MQNAKWHIDKHIVKMPIEYAQLLSTAHRVLDGVMYMDKTVMLMRAPANIPPSVGTEMPQAMPEQYKVKGQPIKAYKNYYIGAKNSFATWKNRERPNWYANVFV